MDVAWLSRLQFALTIMFHYLFPPLTIGLGALLVILEGAWLKTSDPATKLTPRQREILQLLAEGRSAKEIADLLAISPRTVEFHKYQMMETLGLYHSAEPVHFAIKHGIAGI